MSTIKLRSSDNEEIETDIKAAKCSGAIRTLFEIGVAKADSGSVIPVRNVNSRVLKKIIEWSVHHKDNAEAFEQYSCQDEAMLDEWDRNFLNVENSELFEMIVATNYLETRGLFNLMCNRIVNMVKGKSTEEIRVILNIPNDFPTGQEEQPAKNMKLDDYNQLLRERQSPVGNKSCE